LTAACPARVYAAVPEEFVVLHRTLAAVALSAAVAAAPGARAQELASYIRHALEQMEAEWAGQTYRHSYFVDHHALQQGADWTRTFTSAATAVTLVAGCDQDCSGLSLTVYDRSGGAVLSRRSSPGKSLQMTVYPGPGRTLSAVLTVDRCSTAVCYIALTAVH
jgi:hypothetical protein